MSKPNQRTSISLSELTPAFLIHPGEILIDELNARDISQIEFAKTLDLPRSQLNEYIKGKRDFTTDLCLLVARALGMDESIWLKLKQNYEVDRIKMDQKSAQKLKDLAEWAYLDQHLPKKFLKAEGIVTDDKAETLRSLRKIYDVDHLSAVERKFEEQPHAYHRKSQKANVDQYALFTWEILVRQKAENLKVEAFHSHSQAEVLAQLKTIFRENKNAFKKSAALLAQNGIKLIHQPKPDKCAVDGVSFWSQGNPAIGLSLRYMRIDNLAFTLMHELGHVYLHLANNQDQSFIDVADENGSYGHSPKEVEADTFAQDSLISPKAWADFEIKYFKPMDTDFIAFADQYNVHPAIPFGRFCYKLKQFKKQTKIDRELR